KNWFVGIVDLPLPHQVPDLAAADVRCESFRAGGPCVQRCAIWSARGPSSTTIALAGPSRSASF
ncbi:MAG: peptide chain release factor-like protein, partial [Bradyrhizobium sp.]